MRPEVALHVLEIESDGCQVADVPPLVVGRDAVVASALDVDGEQVQSPRRVLRLEQVIGHLSREGRVQRPRILRRRAAHQRVHLAVRPQRERVEHGAVQLQVVDGRAAAAFLRLHHSLKPAKKMTLKESFTDWKMTQKELRIESVPSQCLSFR